VVKRTQYPMRFDRSWCVMRAFGMRLGRVAHASNGGTHVLLSMLVMPKQMLAHTCAFSYGAIDVEYESSIFVSDISRNISDDRVEVLCIQR
jgi:hypothetical protein